MFQTDKQITKLKISDDYNSVHIGFTNQITFPLDEDEENLTENKKVRDEYIGKFNHRPHKNLTDSMKKLRKFALEICEIEVDSKSISQWNVSALSIAGDVTLKTSRVILTLSKKVDRAGKIISFKCPQVTMFPEKEEEARYENAEKMSVIIEDIIEECWSYMNGTFEDETNQLPLFPTELRLQTHFTQ